MNPIFALTMIAILLLMLIFESKIQGLVAKIGPIQTPNDEIRGYVKEFYAEAKRRKRKITRRVIQVAFTKEQIGDKILGSCKFFHDSEMKKIRWTQIILCPAYWDVLSVSSRKALLFHELGHSEMMLCHSKSENQIMSPIISDDHYIAENWDAMLDTFFNTPSSTIQEVLNDPDYRPDAACGTPTDSGAGES